VLLLNAGEEVDHLELAEKGLRVGVEEVGNHLDVAEEGLREVHRLKVGVEEETRNHLDLAKVGVAEATAMTTRH
jgi:hypothetical protein